MYPPRPRLSTLAAALACALAAPGAARAQRTGEEWAAAHARDAAALRASPRGAIALVRLRQLHDYVDPAHLVDRLRAVSADPAVPPARRDLAAWLEAGTRRDLGQLGEAAALTRRLGFLTRWMVIGPFDNEGRAGFGRAFPPEEERRAAPDPGRDYDGKERAVRWRPFPDIAPTGYVSLDAVVRPSVNACAYAHTTVTSPRDEPAVLWLGASGAVAAWVNNARVYADDAVRRAWPDRAGVPVRLRRGANRVLLKVCTDQRGLGFYARFTRPDGAARADLAADPDPGAAPLLDPPAEGALPTPRGVLADLRRAADGERATPQALEDLARFLALTSSDDPAAPAAADLAERAARAAPTAARWLLVADITTDHNRRIEAVRRAWALAPEDPHVLAAVGHERRVGVHPEECVPFLDEAIRRDEAYVLPRVERALFLDSAGLSLVARAELDAAAALAPRAAAVLRARLQVAEHASLGDEAARLRRALLRVRYGDLESHESAARDARQRGERAAVRAAVDRMIELHPERLGVYSVGAELLEAVGEGGAAVGTLARALELAPDEPSLWSAKGAMESRLGQRDDARASMRRALALRPQDATLRQHLEALEPPVPRPDEAVAERAETFLGRRRPAPPPGQREAGDYNLRVLQDLTVRTVYANGLSGLFRQVAIQVQSEQGAQAARTYAMQYDPDAQRFELRGARVYHPDGQTDESTQLQEYNVTGDGSGRMYFSNRVVQVTFPHLAPGDVFEVRWRVDDVSARNAFADYFGDLQTVQGEAPRAHYAYVLRAPSSRRLYFHVAPLEGLTRAERVDEGTSVYSFEAVDVPAIPPEEHAPGPSERAAYIHVSTYRTWEEVGRWYWGLVRDQLIADDRLRNVVRELTARLPTERDKVRAVYNWVLAHTRYVALEFGIHGFQPYPVPQVCWSRGFGDCKDKASVIVTMLREAGIDASLVLLRTRANGRIHTSPASLAVFDHAIAYVPSLDLYLDGTAQHNGMDELPTGDQGVMALIVDQRGNARLVETPVYTADRNVTTVRGEVAVAPNTSATLRVRQEVRGPTAGGVRSTLEAQATRAERIEDDLREHYPGVRVTAVRTSDLDDVEAPARFEYEAAVPQLGTRQGETWLLHAVAQVHLARRFAARTTRRFDVVVGVPSTYDETRTIQLPAGATVTDLPPAAHLESPFGRLDFTVEHRGGALHVRRTLSLTRDRVPPADYAAFRAFCQAVDDALGRRVSVRMP